jgi:hypothetical protein
MWSRWPVFPQRFGIYQAIRFLWYWKQLIPHERRIEHLRMRHVTTGETLNDFPLTIAYCPSEE